ncbi:MAG: glycosyltransferase family 2 protein [Imperialibacter sp.]
MNNDLLVEQNTLFCLAKHYLRHSGHIYGSVPFFNGLPQPITLWSVNNGRVDFDSKLAVEDFFATNGQPLATSEYLELANVHGSSMLIPLNIVEQHGFLDKSFFMYAEEIEFCFRLLSKGITSHLVLSSRVMHESGGSTNDNAKTKQIMSYYQRRNFLVVLRRYRGWPFYLELQKTYFKEFIVRIIKGKRVDRYKMLGCLHALIGLMGKRLSNESLS